MNERFFDIPAAGRDPDRPRDPVQADVEIRDNATYLRFALVLGNGHYPGASLVNAERDGAFVARAFVDLGFSVTSIRNADRAAFVSAIEEFAKAVDAAGPDAVAIFYFAGHGFAADGTNYLLPVDADPRTPERLALSALSLDLIIIALTRLRRRATVLVLDACRVAAPDSAQQADRGYTRGLADLRLNRDGVMVIYSTSAGSSADDGSGPVGPFAGAMVEALPGLLLPGRPVHDVFARANDRVAQASEGRQVPAIYMQGALAALVPDAGDARRLELWELRDPFGTTMRRAVRWLLGVVAILLVAAPIVTWFSAWPETKRAWLTAVHLKPSLAKDQLCAGPWDHKDGYGLSRADWCSRDLVELGVTFLNNGGRVDQAEDAIARGDPKGLVLKAALLAKQNQEKTDPALVAEIKQLATRAAATSLPAGAIARLQVPDEHNADNLLGGLKDISPSQMEDLVTFAAREGHAVGMTMLSGMALGAGDLAGFEAWTEKAASIKTDGSVEFAASELLRSPPSILGIRARESEAEAWLNRAVARAFLPAVDQKLWFDFLKRDRLQPDELAHLLKLLRDAGGPVADYWSARELSTQLGEDQTALLVPLARAAEANVHDAATRMGDLFREGTTSRGHDREAALKWYDQAAAAGDQNAMSRLVLMWAEGDPDPVTSRPRGPIDTDKGIAWARKLAESGSGQGSLLMGKLVRNGAAGAPNREEARRYFQQALADPRFNLSAKDMLAQLNSQASFEEQGTAGDEIASADDALVNIIVYQPLTCPQCSSALEHGPLALLDRLPPGCPTCNPARKRTNTVRVVLRQSWYGAPTRAEIAAGQVVHCAVPQERLALARKVAREHDAFLTGSEAEQRQAVARLVEGVRLLRPLSECLADADLAESLTKQGRFISRDRLPYIIVNGLVLYSSAADELDQALMDNLPADVRSSIPQPDK